MVPRVDVFTLPVGTSGEEAAKQLRTHQYSRVVLTKEKSVDEVAGYLYAKDFLLDPENAKLPSLESVKRELLFVPETQSLLDVLRDMQSRRSRSRSSSTSTAERAASSRWRTSSRRSSARSATSSTKRPRAS